MDSVLLEKKIKEPKPSKIFKYTSIHVSKETKKKIVSDLSKINKKDFGRTVRIDEYLSLAISLITSEHIQHLQEGSLSNTDRLDRDYKVYTAQFGTISKDEYLGKRLNGEIVASVKKPLDSTTEGKTLAFAK